MAAGDRARFEVIVRQGGSIRLPDGRLTRSVEDALAALSPVKAAEQGKGALPPAPYSGSLDAMSVAELRAALARLGLSSRGTRPDLIARLAKALV